MLKSTIHPVVAAAVLVLTAQATQAAPPGEVQNLVFGKTGTTANLS
jgi:hypothetical protein